MEELLTTIERMIESHERFCRDVSKKLEERNKALVEIDVRIGKIIEAAK